MLLSFLKYLIFGSLVLLLGQIQVGHETLATRFHDEVKKIWKWGEQELRQRKIFASLSQEAGREKKAMEEEISSVDRESLLRLLE